MVRGLPAVRGFSGSEQLSAPPPRAGTARSDVSAAPPARSPSPHPDQCGMEGAEASGEGRPAPRPGACAPPPRSPPSFSRGVRRHSSPPFPSRRLTRAEPPTTGSSGLEASLAALSSGTRGEWRAGRMGTSPLRAGRGRLTLFPTRVWVRVRISSPIGRSPRGSSEGMF